MFKGMDRALEGGCATEKKEKLCRSRGGESCAFDGAMIVLQPIADTAHIVHGPITCLGNSWEGRGSLSNKGRLHRMGFTTAMAEMDVIYGSEGKLYKAIIETYRAVKPNAIFVHSTCLSGLIGEDIESVSKKAEAELGVRVIPVSAPGFVGPKNLGNRIAGEALLDHVIGTVEPDTTTGADINLIGEYNIAGDLWLIEPILKEAGINVLSRITGNSTFREVAWSHRARLNAVICSRALINVAKGMEGRYGVPYVEVSFYGKTETAKALRAIASGLGLMGKAEGAIRRHEAMLVDRLAAYAHLRGMKAVLYTGGVKSWSFISALMDLGIEVAAVGTKKSTFEDEEKMREILGEDAPLYEDVTPKSLLKLVREKSADVLIAGGRNQYLAVKEGIPFVDVNQERHRPYAGYEGLLNLAEDISKSIEFYRRRNKPAPVIKKSGRDAVINPLGHSQTIGAAMALQGIDKALPVIHGAQGCGFLGKVLLTKHFREPIALATTKLFLEDVVMGGAERVESSLKEFSLKQSPELIGVLTSGLSEVKGDDVSYAVMSFNSEVFTMAGAATAIHIPTPDYEGGLESGYASAIEAVIKGLARKIRTSEGGTSEGPASKVRVNVLAGSHLTPADFTELKDILRSFGLRPIMLPDLSCLEGGREGFSGIAAGGVTVGEIREMGSSCFTLAVGRSMEAPARLLKEKAGVEYKLLESVAGLKGSDALMETLSMISGRAIPEEHKRQRRVLVDAMGDAHFYLSGKKACLALETDHSIQMSRLLYEAGMRVPLSVVPSASSSIDGIWADEVLVGDLHSISGIGGLDMLIGSSHAEDTAKGLGVPLYQAGFPVYKTIGAAQKVTIGYRGSVPAINEIATKMMEAHK